MADTSISALTQGIPAGNNILPYSTGLNTLGVPVSAIFQNAGDVRLGGKLAIGAVDDPGPSQYNLELRGANPLRGVMGLVYNNAISPNNGAMIQYTQRGLGDWAMGCTAGGINGFSLYRGRGVNSDGTETMRFDGSGNVEFFGTVKSPGSVLQTVYGQDNTQYNFPDPGSEVAPYNRTSTLAINLKSITSKLIINTSVYGVGYRNSVIPGWGLFLFEGNNINTADNLVSRSPYLHMNTSSVSYITGTLNIIAQHTPGILNPTYRLAIQKASAAGTGEVGQYSAYWTIQEIAQ